MFKMNTFGDSNPFDRQMATVNCEAKENAKTQENKFSLFDCE